MIDESKFEDLIDLAKNGDTPAKEALYIYIYEDLHEVARRLMRQYNGNEFQTTTLVNEVVMRFEKADSLKTISSRKVFFSIATRAMNQILIDHYRRRKKLIDSPDRRSAPFDIVLDQIEGKLGIEFEALQLELQTLKEESPRQHAIIMHRFFGGQTIHETAELLGVSRQTVERDWRIGRARLMKGLRESDSPG